MTSVEADEKGNYTVRADIPWDYTAESIVINSDNINILNQLSKDDIYKIFDVLPFWTRITIINGSKYDKDIVLRSILHSTRDLRVPVLPALYQFDRGNSFFLVSQCSFFVNALCQLSLKVPHLSRNVHFSLTITTLYLSTTVVPLNVNLQVGKVLDRRHCLREKTLDLSNFSQDEGLKDIFCPLNEPMCLKFVLRNIKPHPNTIVLQHNRLNSLDLSFRMFSQITELDLRHNDFKWEDFQKLQIKPAMKLTKIWLDGNPLCSNISECEYIQRIKAKIPEIRLVDGIDISNTNFGFASIKNYFIEGSFASFVDHFLLHYFGLMESSNRHTLARMYHKSATFSFCAYCNPHDTANWGRLSSYIEYSRNLLTMSNVNRAFSTMKVGPEEIIGVLSKLPAIKFDPNTFSVDIPFAQVDKIVLINVGGIFKDLHSGLFYFDRTFVLTPFKSNPGEWKIGNDMFSLTPASRAQAEKSFITTRSILPAKTKLLLNPALKDKEVLIETFCDVAKLTKEWASKFLAEGSWDLELTLQAFIDQLKVNQIPINAFNV